MAEQQPVADGAHGAEAAALGKKADAQADGQRDEERRVLGARPLETVEQSAALRLALHLRPEEHEDEQAEHGDGQHQAGCGPGGLGAAQGVAVFQEQGADPDAAGQAGQAEQGVAVAAGEPQGCPPGTAEKDKRADHGEHAQHEADDGRRAGPRPELAGHQGCAQRAEHETDDLGPQVLDHLGPVQAERAGHVALETGHADAHVGRVAEFLQQCGKHADDRAHRDDAPPGGKEVFSLHDRLLPGL